MSAVPRPAVLGLLVWSAACAPGSAQQPCPGYAALVEAGWRLYRADSIPQSDSVFTLAVGRCPGPPAARVGLAYTALRQNRLEDAERRFSAVLAADRTVVDALVGLGLIAWRRGDSLAAVRRFEAVRDVEPENATALDFLGRLAARPPPPRPPLQLPDTVVAVARTSGDRFEVLAGGAWRPFHVNGINLGAALPGRFPSEFPDSATYAEWLTAMGTMGANTVRLYTIHPPHFYGALADHNARHPDQPLRLVHGVWAELPPAHDYRDPAWEDAFFREMRDVVDVVHGRADLPRRPGRAAGHYTADVSRWTLAVLIGREWEPYSVVDFNRLRRTDTVWAGSYVRVAGGSAMDAWLGRALDTLVAYESRTYRMQRPVGYTNWPTLDPMHHPTETTVAEEVGLRAARGERIVAEPREYDNDAVGLDATRLRATGAFRAGIFAAFHAYPYYPDFMVLDPGYRAAVSSEGPSAYFGYLQDLKAHHPDMPVLIAEYGVPASRGIAHLQPQGWHHGGHSERAMAEIDARLTREIAESGMAGGILFAWIDEWFKKNWLVIDFEVPGDRNRLWLNRMDPEQLYGVIALEPEPAVAGETALDRERSWRGIPAVLENPAGTLRLAADAGALWIRFDPTGEPPDELQIAFDVVDSTAGAFTLAGDGAPATTRGLEVVIVVRGDTARVLRDPAVLQFGILPVRQGFTAGDLVVPDFADTPPGYFAGRWAQEYNRPLRPIARTTGDFRPDRVVTNRVRFARDGTEFAAAGYERGWLRPGPLPDGDWERLPDGAVEMRVPWMQLNVSDPSGRHVLFDGPDAAGTAAFGTRVVDHIGVMVGVKRRGAWTANAGEIPAGRFTWSGWDLPRWRARRRPVFAAMRVVWDRLAREHGGGRP